MHKQPKAIAQPLNTYRIVKLTNVCGKETYTIEHAGADKVYHLHDSFKSYGAAKKALKELRDNAIVQRDVLGD